MGETSVPDLGIADVARMFGVSVRTVYRLLDEGMPSYRVGTQHRFDEQEIREHLRARTAAA
jgi:excisionase family DNA binding protein